MGEFGVNDYSFSVFGKTLTQIRSFVPDVVKTISAATEVINPLNIMAFCALTGDTDHYIQISRVRTTKPKHD
jgi:hypothetical protein